MKKIQPKTKLIKQKGIIMKKGFTLGELYITMGIIGVLAAVLLPVMKSAMPDKNASMFRKAYYTTERIVSELINDDDLYPDNDDKDEKYLANTERVKYKNELYEGNTKFCALFLEKLNPKENNGCLKNAQFGLGVAAKNVNAKTADNIEWGVRRPENSSGRASVISVDVNGSQKPNCYYNIKNCKEPDRFFIFVDYDGTVSTSADSYKYLNQSKIFEPKKGEED